MLDISLDKKSKHTAKGAADENAGQEKTCWYGRAIRNYCHQVPDKEVKEEGIVLKDSFLIQQGLDLITFRIEQ